jgi:response regulator RpfG family c-di-GMP phosphodiesterase
MAVSLELVIRNSDQVHQLPPGQTVTIGRTAQCDADFYDALTSARAYRAAMPSREAVQLIREGSGRHFDPRIADALVKLHDRGELNLEDMPSQIQKLVNQ